MVEPVAQVVEEGVVRSPNEERRAAVRHRTALLSPCRPANGRGEPAWLARVNDVSNYGIGLVLSEPLEHSTLLEVDLEGADRRVRRTMLARVVHVEGWGPDEWLLGCAFTTELDDTELQRFHAQRVKPTSGDGRRWVRFPCNVETVCYTCLTTPGERSAARILNISPGGIGLLLPCQFEAGTLLHFEMPAPLGHLPRRMLVRVVRSLAQDNGDWFLGCEFVERLSDEEVRSLL